MIKANIGRVEFIALMAMLAGTVAFSIDAMLPALPEIAADTGASENSVQFVITSFVFGMGIGTLFSGPLSDAFGRRPVIVAGAIVYSVAALVAATSQTLEVILIARAVQGIGAAGPRVATLSIIRDMHSGRQMAKIVSFVMIVFALIPTIAPSLGALILLVADWHGIFVSFAVFSAVSVAWLLTRLPETLPPERRRPFSVAAIRSGAVEIAGRRDVVLAILVQSLVFGILFGTLSSSQPMFDMTFGRGDSFPLWFGGIALVSTSGGFLNAAIVEKIGMRRVVQSAFLALSGVSLAFIVAISAELIPASLMFFAFVLWQTAIFTSTGLTIGNLNALALEPLGHIAGLAASIVTATATILGALVAAPVSAIFDGSVPNVVAPVALMAFAGYGLMRLMPPRFGEATPEFLPVPKD